MKPQAPSRHQAFAQGRFSRSLLWQRCGRLLGHKAKPGTEGGRHRRGHRPAGGRQGRGTWDTHEDEGQGARRRGGCGPEKLEVQRRRHFRSRLLGLEAYVLGESGSRIHMLPWL